MKLKSKFLLLILPMIFLPLLAVSSLSYLYLNETIHRFSITQLGSSLLQLSSDTKDRLHTAASNLILISSNEQLKKHAMTVSSRNETDINSEAISGTLTEIIKLFPGYAEIAVFDKQGELLDSVSEDIKDQTYQTEVIQQMLDSKLDHHEVTWLSPQGGHPYYFIAHAMKNEDLQHRYIKSQANNIGYVFISIDMSFLNDLIREGVEKQGIKYFLTNPQGDIIFSPSVHITTGSAETSTENSFNLKQVISSRSSAISHYKNESITYYAGYKRLTQSLYLVGLVAEEDMFFSALTFKSYVTWFMFLVMFISLILIRMHVDSLLTYPVETLRKLITKFRKGEYEHDLDVLGSDELALLAEDFRVLSQGLSDNSESVNSLAYYDALTGLPNRSTFDISLAKALNHCERTKSVLGLLFIDLDNFKSANDIYGHQAGDQLLKEAAVRLESCLRGADVVSRKGDAISGGGSDIVVRLGGDEFTILLTDINQAHQASMVAQRVVDVLSHPFLIAGAEINIGASIGIAMYPVDGITADRLIKSADLAMYEAKQKGRNNYKFFTKAIDEAVTKRFEVETLLRKAVENDELFLLFQPKVNIETGEVTGVEALIRWQHPDLGVLLPAKFMRVAEESGISVEIGRLVINRVCQQLQLWANEGLENIKVSINLSSLQLLHNGIVNDLKKAVTRYKVNPANIEIELNESVLLADEKNCVDLLNQFKLLGVTPALDNFGTGCLSLEYISKLPFKVIKFDRLYVESLDDSSKDCRVLSATLKLAKAFSFDVVLTGVEREEQFKIVQKMSCENVQGFYFSEAVCANDLKFSYAISP